MSIGAMKQALEALELIDKDIEWHNKSPTRKFCSQAAHFLRQAIAGAEKQEPVNPVTWQFESLGHAMLGEGKPFYRSGKKTSLSSMKPHDKFILVRTGQVYSIKDNGSVWNETENRLSRLHKNCQVEPLYPAPVHASDIPQESVDETAKRKHEWVEITKGECDELFRTSSDHVEYAWAIEAKLKEKNT